MHLTPREIDKLLLHQAGVLAQKRLARGLRLNYVEAVALLGTQILEFIRDGRSVAELMALGRRMLGHRDVLEGVPAMVDEVQVEGTFPDGTKLVTVHHPIVASEGDLALALYGSFLDPVAAAGARGSLSPACVNVDDPGGRTTLPGTIELNAGRASLALEVSNTGDRPIQVGSHYHFVETNRALVFDRQSAYGKRLDIPAGTAVRFEPGEIKTIRLVDIAGGKVIRGGNAWASGPVTTGRDVSGVWRS